AFHFVRHSALRFAGERYHCRNRPPEGNRHQHCVRMVRPCSYPCVTLSTSPQGVTGSLPPPSRHLLTCAKHLPHHALPPPRKHVISRSVNAWPRAVTAHSMPIWPTHQIASASASPTSPPAPTNTPRTAAPWWHCGP